MERKFRNYSSDSVGSDGVFIEDSYYQGMLKAMDHRKGSVCHLYIVLIVPAWRSSVFLHAVEFFDVEIDQVKVECWMHHARLKLFICFSMLWRNGISLKSERSNLLLPLVVFCLAFIKRDTPLYVSWLFLFSLVSYAETHFEIKEQLSRTDGRTHFHITCVCGSAQKKGCLSKRPKTWKITSLAKITWLFS